MYWLSLVFLLFDNVIAESIYSCACKEKEHLVNHQNFSCRAHIKLFSASRNSLHTTTFNDTNAVTSAPQLTYPPTTTPNAEAIDVADADLVVDTLKQLTSPHSEHTNHCLCRIRRRHRHCCHQYFRSYDQLRTCII